MNLIERMVRKDDLIGSFGEKGSGRRAGEDRSQGTDREDKV